jgi:hypothetical protein
MYGFWLGCLFCPPVSLCLCGFSSMLPRFSRTFTIEVMELAGSVVPSSGSHLGELLRFPYRRFTIDSALPPDAARERIRGIIHQSSLGLAGMFAGDKLFAGEFSSERFKVFRIDARHWRGTALVEGTFAPTPLGTRLAIRMRLTRHNAFGALLWFTIATLLMVACILGPMFSPHMKAAPGFALFMAMMLVGGYAILAASFNTEVAKTEAILREALQTQPTARIEEALHPNAARQQARLVKTLRTFAIVISVVAVIVLVILPATLRHSEKFRVARDYIEASAAVRGELGNITSVAPDRWRSRQENYAGTQEGNASFSLDVRGTNRSGVVSVQMQLHRGTWQVVSAELHESGGRTVAISSSGD